MRERINTSPELTPEELLAMFHIVGGYLEGHFIYTSEKHGGLYFNKDAIYPHVPLISKICQEIARRHLDLDINAVVGPALGGIVLCHWTAFHLSNFLEVPVLALYTEKDSYGNQILIRGYDSYVTGKNVLIVEDVITTGESVKKVKRSVEENNGIIKGVCTMVNRNPLLVTSESLGMPLVSLLNIEIESYFPEECPLCKQGIPIDTRVGKGKKLGK